MYSAVSPRACAAWTVTAPQVHRVQQLPDLRDLVGLGCGAGRSSSLSGWPRKFFGGQGAGSWPEAGEVDGAGGVEGFLRGADGEPGDEEGVLVAVVGGGVDREAEGVRGAAVAQAA